MQSGKSVMALPSFSRTRICTGDQHDRLQYSTELEALISLANKMFGLYTWSHNVTRQNIDYIDSDSNKYSVGVVAFVKVELKNGIYHEDVGYGICSNSCCKGYAIACARKEAAANGLREALRSFGCQIIRKVNEPADMSVRSSGLKRSLPMDKHSVNTAGRVGSIYSGEKESDFIDDETLISTQELDRLVQSAEVQQSRQPLVCSPPRTPMQMRTPWPAARGSSLLGNRVMPMHLPMTCRRAPM